MRKVKDGVEVTEGDCVTLEVEVSGYPEPTVTWTKADVEISNDSTGYETVEDGPAHRLIISHAKPQMAGLYSVKAQSDAGQTSCRGRLKVKCKSMNSD